MAALKRLWNRLTLSARIMLGLGLGVLAGLFLGEPAEQLAPVADIYIRLMQMTVLPYLISALVVAFGQLEMADARRLALRGGALLVGVWVVMIAVITAMPLALPPIVSASFYSSALVEPPTPFSLAELYFTSNPFESMSRNVVPAVVLFSCMFGVALIGVRDKARLLDPLRVWNDAIVRITAFVIGLTPIGVFAIAAVTAGTMTLETFARLEAYFLVFGVAALLLTFVILPLAVTAVTPFRYREVVGIARDALLTAFVAQNVFIVLPILVERSKTLFAEHGLLDDRTDSAADVMVPVLFNFPHAGKLLSLLFVPFAAWLSGAAFVPEDYPVLFSAGIPSYFAKAHIALPFLLDLYGLPQDLFQLYVPTTIITGKFDALVGAMNLLVFSLLGAGAMGGFLVFRRARVARALVLMALGTLASVLLVKGILAFALDTDYRGREQVSRMQPRAERSTVTVHREVPEPGATAGERGLAAIRARGAVRIGYDPGNLPFSFFNGDGELVGFDVELAIALATELGVAAEFVPIQWPRVADMLEAGTIDIMPGVWYRPNWFGRVHLSVPYMEGTVGFAVLDRRREEFASIETLRQSRDLVIAVPLDTRQLQHSIRHYFGDARVEFRVIEFWGPYFQGRHPDVDAMLLPVEHASGWTLLHPEYSAVVPQPNPIRVSTAFGLARDADHLADAVDEWIVFAQNTRELDAAYRHWVLGEGAKPTAPRWSILRNVLGYE